MNKAKKIIITLFAIFWLGVITPLFGVFPVLCIWPRLVPRDLFFLGIALIREVFSWFIVDPEPYTSDVGPPLTKLGYITMIVIVFGIAALAANFLWREYHQLSKKKFPLHT